MENLKAIFDSVMFNNFLQIFLLGKTRINHDILFKIMKRNVWNNILKEIELCMKKCGNFIEKIHGPIALKLTWLTSGSTA